MKIVQIQCQVQIVIILLNLNLKMIGYGLNIIWYIPNLIIINLFNTIVYLFTILGMIIQINKGLGHCIVVDFVLWFCFLLVLGQGITPVSTLCHRNLNIFTFFSSENVFNPFRVTLIFILHVLIHIVWPYFLLEYSSLIKIIGRLILSSTFIINIIHSNIS